MPRNTNLHGAREAKKDEFYTQLSDIANELSHYTQHFKGKTVLCNCDDPYESNFFKYFALNFNFLGLKKLICTCWNGSPITQKELPFFEEPQTDDGRCHIAYKLVLNELKDLNGDGAEDLEDVKIFLQKHKPEVLKGNGDFRSPECVELLKEADIVVTNPPFSLFREYVAQLVKHDKKFLIIGNQNAITYKEIFPLIKENKIWLGCGFKAGNAYFYTPYSDKYGEGVLMKDGLVKFRNVCWFTNLDHNKRHDKLDLYKRYTAEEYPKYDNYDAINVDKTADIPMDYDGVMGVPISFLDKYCPEQFEIIWTTDRGGDGFLENIKLPHTRYDAPVVNGKGLYKRILIRKKQQP